MAICSRGSKCRVLRDGSQCCLSETVSQCSVWEVLCRAFVSVNCILCLLCLFVPWTEAQCLLPERYLVVRQMRLDDGSYCDWVRQYGDSSKFWREWWGADCYSITWWRRCWKVNVYIWYWWKEDRVPTLIKMKRWYWMNYELLRLTRDPFWWQWIHIRFFSIIIGFFWCQLLCFHQTFKRKYFKPFIRFYPSTLRTRSSFTGKAFKANIKAKRKK